MFVLEMYKRIKELRKQQGLTQQELAEKTGYHERSSIARIERGDVDISQSKIVEFAKALNTTAIYLMDGIETPEPPPELPDSIPVRTVPVLGTIACGRPIDAIQSYEGDVPLPDGIRADFALQCRGDSMIPRVQPGDLVLIRRQPTVENGQTAAVMIEGEATLKRVYRVKDGLLLVADNSSYPPISATRTEVSICGLAVGIVRKLV